jgi:hypothetical protein
MGDAVKNESLAKAAHRIQAISANELEHVPYAA